MAEKIDSGGGSSPASRWAGFSWYGDVKSIFEKVSVPEWVWGSIIGVESSGNPNAEGDFINGVPTSFGLLQLHTGGGLGDAYQNNPTALFDPKLNASIAAPEMAKAYADGIAKGLSGYNLVEYTASHAGWPLTTGDMPADYHTKLTASYLNQVGMKSGVEIGTGSPLSGVSAGVELGQGENPLLRVFRDLDTIESAKLSVLSPAESTKKVSVMIVFAVLGLILIGLGTAAFVGFGNMVSVVAPEAAPAIKAAEAAGAK